MQTDIARLLHQRATLYNTPAFIPGDPISIPHSFTQNQDIEISGFFAATLAWGNRTAIINSCKKLMHLMGNAPYQFITQHTDEDLKPFLGFVHRTFNATDLLYFIQFLKHHYARYNSLEDAFLQPQQTHQLSNAPTFQLSNSLVAFHNYFFSLPEFPDRTRKHVSTPARHSACKRLCMYLRWMVRHDGNGVDFGLWKRISPAALICPLDVHVARVAHRLGLIPENKATWKTAVALTESLRELNPADPAVYDFALFGIGAEERL